MVFTKRLREGIRRGRIRCTIRIWKHLRVRIGGRYPMDDGHVAIAIESIRRRDITAALAKESGFSSVDELLKIAQHGAGSNIYLIRFHYLPAGAWDAPVRPNGPGDDRAPLLERIQRTPASRARRARKRGHAL